MFSFSSVFTMNFAHFLARACLGFPGPSFLPDGSQTFPRRGGGTTKAANGSRRGKGCILAFWGAKYGNGVILHFGAQKWGMGSFSNFGSKVAKKYPRNHLFNKLLGPGRKKDEKCDFGPKSAFREPKRWFWVPKCVFGLRNHLLGSISRPGSKSLLNK